MSSRVAGRTRAGVAGALGMVALLGVADLGAAAPAGPLVLSLPLKLRDFHLGDIDAVITPEGTATARHGPGQTISVPTARLRTLLDGIVLPDRLALIAGAGSDGMATLEDLRATGIGLGYEPALVELRVDVPAELRARRAVSIINGGIGGGIGGGSDRPVPPPVTTPSGFANLYAEKVWLDGAPPGHQRGPVSFAAEAIARPFGADWPLVETSGDYRQGRARPWQRGPTRTVFEVPDTALRFSAGDLSGRAGGFRLTSHLAGIGVERDYALQPLRQTRPIPGHTLTIERASTVAVVVNGQPQRTLRLEPGRYDIRDFPFYNGLNDIEFIIEDATGHRETVRTSAFVTDGLLGAGLDEFAYAVGFRSVLDEHGLSYRRDQPVAEFSHRLGLNDLWTLGLSGAVDRNAAALGTSVVTAAGGSLIDVDVGGSLDRERGGGAAAALRYRTDFSTAPREGLGKGWVGGMPPGAILEMALSVASRGFQPGGPALGPASGLNETAVETAVRLSAELAPEVRGSVATGYAWGHGDAGNRATVAGRIMTRFDPDLYLAASVEWLSDDDRRSGRRSGREWRALIGLTRRFGLRDTGAATVDTATRSRRLEWIRSPRGVIDDLAGFLALEDAAGDRRVAGSASYIANRFEAGVAHDGVLGVPGDRDGGRRTTVRAATSLAFADGAVGIGQPIRGGYALVVPHPTLAGGTVLVNPRSDGVEAMADAFGPAVVPNLSPYRANTVTVDVQDGPPAYDIGPGVVEVVPSSRSGARIDVGSDDVVSATGFLVTETGKPISHAGGRAYALDDPAFPPRPFFTNEAGRFFVPRLKPGRYDLRLATNPGRTVGLTVPAGAVGMMTVGRVVAPRN